MGSIPSVARAAGLFGQKGDRIGFVHQAQTALFVARTVIRRIEKDAAAHEDPVGVGHKRGDPAHVEIAPVRSLRPAHAVIDVAADRLAPMAMVGGVDGVFGHARRDGDPGLHEGEVALGPVKHEEVHAAAQRHHQGGLRPVDEEARGDLRAPGLGEGQGRMGRRFGTGRKDREDGAHRGVHIDVGAAVQGIDGHGQLAEGVEQHRLLHLLGEIAGDGGLAQGGGEQVLGHEVQLALGVAIAVGRPGGGAQASGQGRRGHDIGEQDGRVGHEGDGVGGRFGQRRMLARADLRSQHRFERGALLHRCLHDLSSSGAAYSCDLRGLTLAKSL